MPAAGRSPGAGSGGDRERQKAEFLVFSFEFLVGRAGVVDCPTKYEIRNANEKTRVERYFIENQLDALAEAWFPAGA